MIFTVNSTMQLILPTPMVFLDFKFLHQQLKVGLGLGFVYIISLFTFEKIIVLNLITLYLYK
jgi:hypothetical protein